MFDFPNVPTESLYKFMALGGIIAIFATGLLFVTEWQNVSVQNIKYNTSIDIQNIGADKFTKSSTIVYNRWLADSLEYIQHMKEIERAKLLVKSKSNKQVEFRVDDVVYSAPKFENYVKNQYIANMRYYNKRISEINKVIEPGNITAAKIKEQRSLLELNNFYVELLSSLSGIVVFAGGLCSYYGFKRWHEMQEISDELSRMQLAKAKQESEKESSQKA